MDRLTGRLETTDEENRALTDHIKALKDRLDMVSGTVWDFTQKYIACFAG